MWFQLLLPHLYLTQYRTLWKGQALKPIKEGAFGPRFSFLGGGLFLLGWDGDVGGGSFGVFDLEVFGVESHVSFVST